MKGLLGSNCCNQTITLRTFGQGVNERFGDFAIVEKSSCGFSAEVAYQGKTVIFCTCGGPVWRAWTPSTWLQFAGMKC
jgi:transketolase C-terminal domain/subunit